MEHHFSLGYLVHEPSLYVSLIISALQELDRQSYANPAESNWHLWAEKGRLTRLTAASLTPLTSVVVHGKYRVMENCYKVKQTGLLPNFSESSLYKNVHLKVNRGYAVWNVTWTHWPVYLCCGGGTFPQRACFGAYNFPAKHHGVSVTVF